MSYRGLLIIGITLFTCLSGELTQAAPFKSNFNYNYVAVAYADVTVDPDESPEELTGSASGFAASFDLMPNLATAIALSQGKVDTTISNIDVLLNSEVKALGFTYHDNFLANTEYQLGLAFLWTTAELKLNSHLLTEDADNGHALVAGIRHRLNDFFEIGITLNRSFFNDEANDDTHYLLRANLSPELSAGINYTSDEDGTSTTFDVSWYY